MTNGLSQPIRPLTSVVRESNLRDNGKFYGPDPENDCPCGSRRQARRCHRAEDHSWIAKRPPALLTDARTGYANAGCYGRSSNDCDEELTLEHYISDDVLESISADKKIVAVKGAAWLPAAEEKTVGVASIDAASPAIQQLKERRSCPNHNRL